MSFSDPSPPALGAVVEMVLLGMARRRDLAEAAADHLMGAAPAGVEEAAAASRVRAPTLRPRIAIFSREINFFLLCYGSVPSTAEQ